MDKAGDLIRNLFNNGFTQQKELTLFFACLPEALGKDLASHTKILDIRNGSVIVEVDHPGWMQVFQMNQRKILGHLKKAVPEMKLAQIQIRLSDMKSKSPGMERLGKSDQEPGSRLDPEVPKKAVAEIKDEKLKSLLKAIGDHMSDDARG